MTNCEYLEILKDSRKIDISQTSSSQDIVVSFEIDPDQSSSFTQGDFLGAEDDVLALETAYSIFPMYRILPDYYGDPIFLSLDNISLEQMSMNRWKATAKYKYDLNSGNGAGDPNNPEAESLPFIRINFNIGGQTTLMTTSLELKEIAGYDGIDDPGSIPFLAPLTGRAIGVTDDGIEGTEVLTGGLQLDITVFYFPTTVTFDFIRVLSGIQRTVNDAEFLTFEIGEALLTNVSGGGTVGEIVPITFNFDMKPNITDKDDSPFTDLTMEGHDVLDYRYEKQLDDNTEQILLHPRWRYTHRVYEKSDFSLLGIPGA
jgi:hypothetical protein